MELYRRCLLPRILVCCRKHAKLICWTFLCTNQRLVTEELFLLHLSAVEHPLKVAGFTMWSVSSHNEGFFLAGTFSWLQISKMSFCMPSLFTSAITWLVRVIRCRGLWAQDDTMTAFHQNVNAPSPAEPSSLPVDQGFLSCPAEWGWCDSAELGSCFCSSIESDPLAKVLPTLTDPAALRRGFEKVRSDIIKYPMAEEFPHWPETIRNFLFVLTQKSLCFKCHMNFLKKRIFFFFWGTHHFWCGNKCWLWFWTVLKTSSYFLFAEFSVSADSLHINRSLNSP